MIINTTPLKERTMNKTAVLSYGVVAYAVFFVTFLYMIGFAGDLVVPKAINTGTRGALGTTLAINLALLGLFGVQHSVMARPWFKRWWTQFVPEPIERSTYVLIGSLILLLIFWQWRPMTDPVWEVENTFGQLVLWTLFGLGWVGVLASSFLIDHFDLFGLRQVVLYFRGKPYTAPEFSIRSLYKVVRHPLMLGFLIAFWSTPHMTSGHFLFAGGLTAYILVAIQIEERDLARHHGESYEAYRRQVRMLIPLPKRRT